MTNQSSVPDCTVSALDEIARETAHYKSAPLAFFDAWKRGVELAGHRFFGNGPCADLDRAASKWDLCPKMHLIDHALGPMSPSERIFLASLTSFYNAHDGGELLRRADFEGLADLGRLDLKRRTVIAQLILNYTGW